MKRLTTSICCLMLLSMAASAQRYKHQQKIKPTPVKTIEKMSVDGRFGYDYYVWDGMTSNDNTGFKGKYLSFSLSGHIVDNLSYEYRQRLDNIGTEKFFDATELLNIKWGITKAIHLTAGKQLVAMGGFDYNTEPIDRYFTTEFLNQFSPYQFGVAFDFNLGKRDNIMIQGTNTPLKYTTSNHLYAGSLKWTGRHGFYTALWSVNMSQFKLPITSEKKWMNYVALGNKFNITPGIYIYVDAMNRMMIDDMKFLDDYSVSAELSAELGKGIRIHGKYTRDVNIDTKMDACVVYDTKLSTAFGGIEYKPLKHDAGDLTIFANGLYSWGENDNADGFTFEKEIRIEAGVKLHLDIIGAIKSIKK